MSESHAPHGFLSALQSLLYALIVSIFLITFTVQPIRIPSGSMEPTLLIGDFLLLDKAAAPLAPGPLLPPTRVLRGDVVVFHDPVDDPSIHLVKRVIGLPGDRLHLRDGTVLINGQALPEPYTRFLPLPHERFRDDFPSLYAMDPRVDAAWWIQLRTLVHDGEITVPPNRYFVMGDNRNNSQDSRYWGFVPRTAIIGKPLLVYFSAPQTPTQTTLATPRWHRLLHIIH